MSKALVETIGDHMYVDPINGQVIEADRPAVVEVTSFVSQKIADGQIKLLTPNLPEEATDEDFLKTHDEFKGNENGTNSSVASYAATFGLDETGNTLPDGSAKVIKEAAKLKAEKEKEAAEKEEAEKAAALATGQKSTPDTNKSENPTPPAANTGTGKDNYQPTKTSK